MQITPIQVDEALFAEAVELLKAGQADRPAAAAHAGMKLATFQTHLRRRGLLEQLKHVRRNAGPNAPLAEKDPDKVAAYASALNDVLVRGKSVLAAARAYPDKVNAQVLGRKVRAARAAQAATSGAAGRSAAESQKTQEITA